LSVAIGISYRGIVGRIGKRSAIGRNATFRALQLYGQIVFGGICSKCKRAFGNTATDLVNSLLSEWLLIDKECATIGQGFGIQFLTVTIDIEWLVNGIG